MMSPERAYRLRSAFTRYARGNGTRPVAKVAQRPCSGPHGESRAAAWQEPWNHLLNIPRPWLGGNTHRGAGTGRPRGNGAHRAGRAGCNKASRGRGQYGAGFCKRGR